MHIDEVIDARLERSALWAAACRGEITGAQLYGRLAELRRRFGDALYDRRGPLA